MHTHVPTAELDAYSPAESAYGGDDKAQPVLNVVVCGTLMAAYEQAGKWRQVGPLSGCRSACNIDSISIYRRSFSSSLICFRPLSVHVADISLQLWAASGTAVVRESCLVKGPRLCAPLV